MSNSQILTVIPLHKSKWKIMNWWEYIFYKHIYLMPIYLSYDHLNSRKAQFGSHSVELTPLLIISSSSWPWKRKFFSFLFRKNCFFSIPLSVLRIFLNIDARERWMHLPREEASFLDARGFQRVSGTHPQSITETPFSAQTTFWTRSINPPFSPLSLSF